MFGKMLIHALVGAAVIGSAAAVFAQAKDNGYLKPDIVQTRPVQQDNQPVAAAAAAAAADRLSGRQDARDRGYLVDGARAKKGEHHHDGRRHHDDDDD